MSDIPELPQLEPYVSDSNRIYEGRRQPKATTVDLPAHPNSNSNSTSTPSTTAAANEEGFTPRRSSFLEQDEGVLMDVLQELDKERQKRAELEARVRVLEQEVHIQRKKSSKSSKTSMREYNLVKTERDGYKEILDALTQDRPAFSASHNSSGSNSRNNANQPQSLPIHIVRLLEVMPWDSRAQQYTFGQEEVYEWQIYSADKKWQRELRHFPTFFKTLPIVVPTPGKVMSDEAASSKSQPFFGASVAPPKQCVLTDLEGNTILNIDKGYPLPSDGGGWTWVGPWKVEKNMDTDEQGWAYSNEIEIMSHRSTYRGEFKPPEKGTANITKRRRKWIRPRTLIDYPYASNMTREYLKLNAERSRLDASVEKLSGQLVETKMGLTTLEAEKLQTDSRIRELELDLQNKNQILGLVENGAGLKLTKGGGASASTAASAVDEIVRTSDASSKSSDSSKKVDEIRSAVTQWVSNIPKQLHNANEENMQKVNAMITEVDGDPGAIVSKVVEKSIAMAEQIQQQHQQKQQQQQHQQHDPKQQFMDSLRDKGTGFLEILKQKGEELDKKKKDKAGGGLPWKRKEGVNSSSNHGEENGGSLHEC